MAGLAIDADRDKEIVELAGQFGYDHLSGRAADTSALFYDTAQALVDSLRDGMQLKLALGNLLIAKDAAVRAALRDEREDIENG